MTASQVNRRKALTVVVAAPATVALTSVPAFASAGEDAELLRLWEEWNAQFARWGGASKVYDEIEGKVMDATPPQAASRHQSLG
jgi:hypothetical protein